MINCSYAAVQNQVKKIYLQTQYKQRMKIYVLVDWKAISIYPNKLGFANGIEFR